MKAGIYRNLPCSRLKVPLDELHAYLNTQVLFEKDLSELVKDEAASADLTGCVLHISGLCYPIAFSSRTPEGDFHVVEKWEYPYHKAGKHAYLPGDKNPIGKHLIVLADLAKGEKLPYSIHQWPSNQILSFRTGLYSAGCIRTRQSNMAEIFNYLELGTKIVIKK